MARTTAFSALIAAAVALPLVAAPVAALAQRDPAYAAARAAGQVGEKMDGYLGYVTPPNPALKAVEQADRTGDYAAVHQLLLSDATLTAFGRKLLADWVERRCSGRTGPKSTPIYAVPLSETTLLLANEDLKHEITENNMSVEAAAKVVALRHGLASKTLLDYHHDRLGFVRRARAKRRTLKER